MKNINAQAFLEYFHKNRIKIVVQRSYEKLPEIDGGDLDIEIKNEDYSRFTDLFNIFCKNENIVTYKFINRPHVKSYKLVQKNKNGFLKFSLDVHTTGASWYGMVYLENSSIITSSTSYKNFFIPHPLHEQIIKLFVNLLIGSSVPVKYLDEISAGFKLHKQLFIDFFEKNFKGMDVEVFYEHVTNKNEIGLKRLIHPLKKTLCINHLKNHFWTTIVNILRVVLAEIRFYLQKEGVFIVMLGPDGVGKTTIAQKLLTNFRGVFKKGLYFHWIPPIFSTFHIKLNNYTRMNIPKINVNRIVYLISYVRLLKNFTSAWLVYLLRILPEKYRDRIIIGDRFYFTYYFDPLIVKFYPPVKIINKVLKYFPKPNIILILEAEADTIKNRKNELVNEEILSITSKLRYLVNFVNGVRIDFISANSSIEEVTASCEEKIVQFKIENRYEKTTKPSLYSKSLHKNLIL